MSNQNQQQELQFEKLSARLDALEAENRLLRQEVAELRQNQNQQKEVESINTAPGLQSFLQKLTSRVSKTESLTEFLVTLVDVRDSLSERIENAFASSGGDHQSLDKAIEVADAAVAIVFNGDKSKLKTINYTSQCVKEMENVVFSSLSASSRVDEAIRRRELISSTFGVQLHLTSAKFHKILQERFFSNETFERSTPEQVEEFAQQCFNSNLVKRQEVSFGMYYDSGFFYGLIQRKVNEIFGHNNNSRKHNITPAGIETLKMCVDGCNNFRRNIATWTCGEFNTQKRKLEEDKVFEFPANVTPQVIEVLSKLDSLVDVEARNIDSVESLRHILVNVKNMKKISFFQSSFFTDEWVRVLREVGHPKLKRISFYVQGLTSIEPLRDAKKTTMPSLERIALGYSTARPFRSFEDVEVS